MSELIYVSDKMGENTEREVVRRLINTAKIEVFRLETLNTYLVDGEKKEFEDFRNGIFKRENDSSTIAWLEQLERRCAEGTRFIGIHVIDLPLSDYLRFEIETNYELIEEKGQRIFMLERSKTGIESRLLKDFWMFNEDTVVEVNYDREGRWLSFGKLITDKKAVEGYLHIRDQLLSKALPLDKFMRLHDPRKRTKN
jgi:hypothetical protein